MEDRAAVVDELKKIKPTHVFNAAGCTGRPNVDWCEDNKEQTVRSNVLGAANLADCCYQLKIHHTVFATGCLYSYNDKNPIGGKGFAEGDPPNFAGSWYSKTKAWVEPILGTYNCLILRLRMPVSDDLHPRSFVTKILSYDKVVDIPNSMSILHDLLPGAIMMAEHGETGVYNFTNPGAISHNEVLSLFKDIVRPDTEINNFSYEEQAKILKAGRSNCTLDTNKLQSHLLKYDIELPEIHEAFRLCFERMKAAGIK